MTGKARGSAEVNHQGTQKVCRLYVEKRPGFDAAATNLTEVLRKQLSISGLEKVRVLQRYDFYHPGEDGYEAVRDQVFSDPSMDMVFEGSLPEDGGAPEEKSLPENGSSHENRSFRIDVEYMPGQFDARAEAASQAAALVLDLPAQTVHSARVYLLYGDLSEDDMKSIRSYLINPVDSREASAGIPATLDRELPSPEEVPVLAGFSKMSNMELDSLRQKLGLAMFQADIEMCREYFSEEERRDPSLAELKILDTYWSDHCRHTTFTTRIDELQIEDGPWKNLIQASLESFEAFHGRNTFSLMDLALAGMRQLKREGKLDKLEESDEVNAASVEIEVQTNGGAEQWLLMFKNETHNHPTEIEPFGGAATCLGGAIRDPLSGRAYVYQALRLSGSADPTAPLSAAREGKLPQRVITTEAAHGYSSYGNQIGIATGYVHEVYHPGFEAKRMEVGAVIGAVPKAQVRREQPVPGDLILLIGGATGRDGIGGAAGSSKQHDSASLESAAAEVQKGNPPEERALQRLFREKDFAGKIKKSNDFGAGGVSVAVGELAPGLEIDLDAVPKKYQGLDGLELALSESQERMAVVISPEEKEFCIRRAAAQNLQAVVIATVSSDERLKMNWNGQIIADISRSFLDSSGAARSTKARITSPRGQGPFSRREGSHRQDVGRQRDARPSAGGEDRNASLARKWLEAMSSLANCSRQGLTERFDSTIGARTVLMPFGGERQLSPAESMVAKIPVPDGQTDTASVMSAGYDPEISQWSPYHGGMYAVVEATARALAAGASLEEMYLSFQEYFERLGEDQDKWGQPAAALLGAYQAQKELGIAAIGGKDSMSGSFEELHVPPTLAAFAVAPASVEAVRSPEFKHAGDTAVLLEVPIDENGLIDLSLFKQAGLFVHRLIREGYALSVRSIRNGGIAAALAEMSFGNLLGIDLASSIGAESSAEPISWDALSFPRYGSFLLELKPGCARNELPSAPAGVHLQEIGTLISSPEIRIQGETLISLHDLLQAWKAPLEEVFPTKPAPEQKNTDRPEDAESSAGNAEPQWKSFRPLKPLQPRVCIPVFPGTNCEDESALRFHEAGAVTTLPIFKWKNMTQMEQSIDELAEAIHRSQILMLPGGFSAGDEPDGAAKYIAAVLRSPSIKASVEELLNERGGLMLGICNGFQALIRTGLLPFGEYRDPSPGMPVLAANNIGRHVSRYVRTLAVQTDSPWLQNVSHGDIHSVPVSHGEGRFTASEELLSRLFADGQVAFQYCDAEGRPARQYPDNPNGSMAAIEGLISPDGRILGKMGHSERIGRGIALNIPGEKDQRLFRSAADYFNRRK